MPLQNMNDYISELQAKEDADKLKWQDYADKVKTLNERNSVLGGAARFADTYAALNPRGLKSEYGKAYPDVKESEVLAQNLLEKTKPKDNQAGILRIYQQQQQAENKKGNSLVDEFKRTNLIQADKKTIESQLDPVALSMGKLNNALESANYMEIMNQLSTLAKTVGSEVSRLTEDDIHRALPATLGMDLTKIGAYLTSNPSVAATPKVVASLREAAHRAKQSFSKYTENLVKQRASSTLASPVFKPVKNEYEPMYQELANGYKTAFSPSDEETSKYEAIGQLRKNLKEMSSIKDKDPNKYNQMKTINQAIIKDYGITKEEL
jgi:hypothetical protein